LDVQAYLAESARRVDPLLDLWLPASDAAPASLAGAMRHLVFPGGKRLRPALAFGAAECVGAAPERALPVAAAVELVHTWSLVHDDLPCMDDDVERRGRPTVHVVYGEATAVLAGDALLAAAFEGLAGEAAACAPGPALAALRELARAAGAGGLVGGQVDDLSFPPDGTDAEQVEAVHRRKTGALFRAAVVGGAAFGGADAAALERLARFGECIGVAFQITDDRLDAAADEPCSLVRVLGAEAAEARAAALLADAQGALEPFGAAAERLCELARFAVMRRT
jgi:geranylgeranyl pyrophosphate synthase